MERIALNVGGQTREYWLHSPQSGHDSILPAVLLLHGTGGTAKWAALETRFTAAADRHDFIAVVPQALPPAPEHPPRFLANPPAWNAGGTLFPGHHPDDVSFFQALFDDLPRHAAIDPHRLYVTGFSNGASMAFELAVHCGDHIAAIAPVAGYCRVQSLPTRPMPTLFIIGNADPLVPPYGGQVQSPWTNETHERPSALAGLDRWATAIGCSLPRELIHEDNDIRLERYPGLTEFTVMIVDELGHHWPGGRGQLKKKLAGPTSDRLDANEAVWAFFVRQKKTDLLLFLPPQ